MTLNPLQQRKLVRLFNVLDEQAKGYLEEEDLFRVSECLDLLWISTYQIENSVFNSYYDNLWKQISQFSVSGDPDKVYPIDWLSYFDAVLNDEKFIKDVITDYAHLILKLFGNAESQIISIEKFQLFIEIMGVDKELTRVISGKLETSKRGYFNYETFIHLYHEFFKSADLEAVGNYLFGPI